MHWEIRFFPFCTHHVFLSHCREDRQWLLRDVCAELQKREIIPWFDQHDYPYGRSSFQALRDGVLKSRHIVFFITDAMLSQARGWPIVELAWADLLQENLREPGGVLQTIALPLVFVDRGDSRLPRSVWQSLIDRAIFYTGDQAGAAVWATRQIEAFVLREAQIGADNAIWLEERGDARERLRQRPGLVERVTAVHPVPLSVDADS